MSDIARQPVRERHPDLKRVPPVPSIGVVVAAYDEASAIGGVIDRVRSSPIDAPLTVYVSSDGSSDGTELVAADHGARVVHRAENRGKAAALRDGVELALRDGCDVVAFIDGDGQHDAADLLAVVTPLMEGRADVVLGSRYVVDGSRGITPWNRYLVRTVTCRLLRWQLGSSITDPYCGYRAFTREAVGLIGFEGSRYQCELEMLFVAKANGLRMREVPVRRIYGHGMTKMGASHGRLLGRIAVISQYGRALVRGTRMLRHSRTPIA